MAIRDEVKAERAKLKGAPLKKKIAYYVYYYKIPVIAAAFIIILAIAIIKTAVTKKDPAVSAIFINCEHNLTSQDITDKLESKVAKEAAIDTGKYDIDIDMSKTLTPGGARDQVDYGALERVEAQTMNKGLDALVADAWNFNYFVEQTYYSDLRDVLTDEELKKYQDDLYYVDMTELDKTIKKMQSPDYTPEVVDQSEAEATELTKSFVKPAPETMDDPVPVGVIINDGTFIKKNGVYKKSIGIFGFVRNGKHKKAAEKLLEVLMED